MFEAEFISELEIVAHRGAENASGSLSSLLGHNVSIIVNGVEFADIEEIPERMSSGDMITVGLLSRVTGMIEGNSVLLFSEKDAAQLVQALGSKKQKIEGFGDMERSMLEETANITISSFMNSITSHLNRKCVPNAPIFLVDLAGAILSVILMESAEVADRAILFSTKFLCKDEDMQVMFVFLPSPPSLLELQGGLTDVR
ncbi:hypothetical protein BVY04_03300 [bacterium M21]|nr:hypothetical protein BVY04_03300 [bacterium M21]